MRILILANYGLGLYKFRRELITELVEKEHQVVVSVPFGDFSERLESLGCKVVHTEFERRGKDPFAELTLLNRYRRIIHAEKPDAVLTYTVKPNVYGGLACRMARIPYIANITGLGTSIDNGGVLAAAVKTLYKIGLKRASCVFFQNRPNRDLFVKEGIFKGNTHIIPGSGVNLSEHNVEAYPCTEDGVRFLFIGRVMKDKGIEELLAAIHIVKEECPGSTLDIVGRCDEDYAARLQAEEQAGYICYHGEQSSVHDFIKNSHCTVLPSYHEGTANVLLESASTGRPVIATRVTGCVETFDEGTTGFGCEVQNADGLAQTMLRFIRLSDSEKQKMGLAGREKMEAQYDRNIVIKAYTEEIKSIKRNG